ncbi:MAG: hypothetical protein L0J15_05210 [Lactococcus sp.]|nr:hypothetical protein [Lactococcus sp.]
MKTKQLKRKFKISKLLIFSAVYILTTAVVIIFLNQHTTAIDTDNLMVRAYAVSDILKKNPDTKFDESVIVLPTNTDSKAVDNIKNGARFTRTLTKTNLTITVPNYQ